MLVAVRTGFPARLLAALLALAFTGAPGIAAGLADGDRPEAHRCTCAARGTSHECSCPFCHAASVRKHEAGDASRVPSCHRKPAFATPPQQAPPPDGAPCVQGACGDPQGPRAVLTGLEPFTLPQAGVEPGPGVQAAATPSGGAPPSASRAPDVPPPRA